METGKLLFVTSEILGVGRKYSSEPVQLPFRTCSVTSACSVRASSLENMVEYCRDKNNPVMFSVVEC